jgi:hypothetical protein
MSATRAEQIERLEEMRKSALSMAGFRRGNDPEAEKRWRADAEALEAGAEAIERMSAHDDLQPITDQWLKEQGAITMQPLVGLEHLAGECMVLGGERNGCGFPIEWNRRKNRDGTHVESWAVFGIRTAEPLTRNDVLRVMQATKEVQNTQ